MSSVPVQKGASLELGFGSYLITATQMERVTTKPDANVDQINDDNDAAATIILTNPRKMITANFKLKTSGSILSTLQALVKGDTYTINSVAYRIEDIEIVRSRKAVEVTISGIKEDSMTYS